MFRVNVNTSVRVKLTDWGVSILKGKHDVLMDGLDEEYRSEFELKLDAEGYYRTQLWVLMKEFGPYCGLGMKPPFLIDIIIEDGVIL
jgi:hypothetical protein